MASPDPTEACLTELDAAQARQALILLARASAELEAARTLLESSLSRTWDGGKTPWSPSRKPSPSAVTWRRPPRPRRPPLLSRQFAEFRGLLGTEIVVLPREPGAQGNRRAEQLRTRSA